VHGESEAAHIDGDRGNNVPSNLRVLCRNCHGLTQNHPNKEGSIKRVELTLEEKKRSRAFWLTPQDSRRLAFEQEGQTVIG
jgi:hypothetical protein